MKTRNLSRHSRSSRLRFPSGTAAALPTAPAPGSWRYASVPRTRWTLAFAALAAAGLHAAMFYGFPAEPVRRPAAAAPRPEAVVQMEMAPLPPEESDDPPQELVDAPAAIAVPQLAEMPASVALSAFTQTIDLRPRTEVDLAAMKSLAIPVSRARGQAGLAGQGAIFSLAQLDRAPQPIAQPKPNFPADVRTASEEVVVVVEFVVDADGRVVDARVTSSNAPEFNSAALVGIARWKFRPGVKAGRKVATRMEVPLRFQLAKRE